MKRMLITALLLASLAGLQAADITLTETLQLPECHNTGIHDGHTGSVPVSHSLHAFNALAEASGKPDCKVAEADIDFMVKAQRIPAAINREKQSDPERQKTILFRRSAGQARITVFEGGHDSEKTAALEWLARQRLGQPADFSLGKSAASVAEAVGR